MANASSADARAGYELFKRSGATASRDVINKRLTQAGYRPISNRMHRHYRNLHAAGSNRYISINRFDVARAAQPYENLASNSRYRYASAKSKVRVTFPRGRRLVEAFGVAEEIGETGLILVFTDSATVRGLMKTENKPRLNDELRIELIEQSGQFDARIVDVDSSTRKLRLEVEFERLQSIAHYIGRDPLRRQRYSVEVVPAVRGDVTVDVIGRQLYHLFEVLETARSLVNEAADAVKDGRYAPVTHVHELRMRSPLVVQLGLPEPVAMVLLPALGILSTLLAFERWRKARLENNSRSTQNQVQEARAALDLAVTQARVEIVQRLRKTFRFTGRQSPEELAGLAQLLDAVKALGEQDVTEAKLARTSRKRGDLDEGV